MLAHPCGTFNMIVQKKKKKKAIRCLFEYVRQHPA